MHLIIVEVLFKLRFSRIFKGVLCRFLWFADTSIVEFVLNNSLTELCMGRALTCELMHLFYSFPNVPESRLHGLQDNMHMLISLTQITSGEHCTALLLGCVTQNFPFVLILSLRCALLWKPAMVTFISLDVAYIFLDC